MEIDKSILQLRFTRETDKGRYTDCICYDLTDVQRDMVLKSLNVSIKDVIAEQDKRTANWLSVVSAPALEPSVDDFKLELANKESELKALQDKITEMEKPV